MVTCGRGPDDHDIEYLGETCELIASELLAAKCPVIRETALQIADPQVRYCGTIGGNVANGDPGNDMPAVMMALDAVYRLKGAGDSRHRLPHTRYYRTPRFIETWHGI